MGKWCHVFVMEYIGVSRIEMEVVTKGVSDVSVSSDGREEGGRCCLGCGGIVIWR